MYASGGHVDICFRSQGGKSHRTIYTASQTELALQTERPLDLPYMNTAKRNGELIQ